MAGDLAQVGKGLHNFEAHFVDAEILHLAEYFAAAYVFQTYGDEISTLEESVSREVFKVLGDDLPPDTLRWLEAQHAKLAP